MTKSGDDTMHLYLLTIHVTGGKVYTIEKTGKCAKEVEEEVQKTLKWFEKIEKIRRIG